MRRIHAYTLMLLAVLVLLVACSKERPPNDERNAEISPDVGNEMATNLAEPSPSVQTPEEPEDTEQETAEEVEAELSVTLTRVFPDLAFEQPVGMAVHPQDPNAIYVVEKQGTIVRVDRQADQPSKEVFLDITDRVHSRGMEQGLLGLAFHPDVREHPYFYVNYTTSTHTVIARFADPYADVTTIGAFQPADSSTEREVLTYRQPYTNHNGGDLKFGPDGYLYISSGDGGSAGDPHGYAQQLQSLLGKLLRIDVSREENGRPYAIPKDNPFADRSLHAEARPEIYAYGLRNPWRFSFDDETGTLWAADVGQDEIEEINVITSGGNYGWNVKEGSLCYLSSECEDESFIDPVYEYDHSLGASITGGYVYRGKQLPGLRGQYVYADFMSGRIWALKYDKQEETVNTELMDTDLAIASFGEDVDQELYLLTLDGELYMLTAE